MVNPGFTLCFLLYEADVLLIHRQFPPNQGLWNGVGGHIEPGETPRQAIIREVAEETGFHISDPEFSGILTWDGFEIAPGGIVIFTAEVPHRNFVSNHEGTLAWKSQSWACSSPQVVDNIHVFLPRILAGDPPLHYHFSYQEGVRIKDTISDLPLDFNVEKSYQPENDLIEMHRGDFLLSTDKDRLQRDVIEDFLSKQSYWAAGRPTQVITQSLQHSVCFGIYHQGHQIAFARLVTDEATFAWLCDVFVDKKFRGQGLGKWLVEAACNYIDRKGITQTLLATRDAHSLYTNYGGFQPLSSPEFWLRRKRNDVV